MAMKTFLFLNFATAIAQLSLTGLTDIIASQQTCSTEPPNFPLSNPIVKEDFENFGETVHVRNLWKVVARTSYDVVILANWAFKNNYTIRPVGKMHTWSPLIVTEGSNCGNTILVDTTQYLTGIEVFPNGIENYSFPVVKVESGALVEDLLTQLELKGFGFTASAAIGKITIGGLCAISGHGAGIKVANSLQHIKNYGSVVNRIVKIEAVAWNKESKSYSLRTFDRSMHEVSALMTHLGLAFITSMTLRVEKNYKIHCIGNPIIPNSEVYASPVDGKNARTLSSFLENYGRVAVVSLPYVKSSSLMLCNEVETCPSESRQVYAPYTDSVFKNTPKTASDIIAAIFKTFPIVTPIIFNLLALNFKPENSSIGTCGASKNLLLVMEPDTIRLSSFAYAILTKRENIQQVVHMLKNEVDSTLQKFQEKLSFPMTGPMDFRITELDDPNDIGPEAQRAFIAVTTPSIEYPEFDVALWFELATFEGTPDSLEFLQMIESYINLNFNGTLGLSRPEWSKGWAVAQSGKWTNTGVMHDVIANRYGDQWEEFVKVCNDLDPHKIFRNKFLNQLFI